MTFTIRMHRDAIADLYRIERGTAATVSQAIRRLERNPYPPGAEPMAERPGVYSIETAGYLIAYEVNETERIVNVAWIDVVE